MISNSIILFIFLFLSAFFSGTEVAFLSLSNAQVESMVKKKLHRAELIKKMKRNPRRLLVTILIGNNVVNIAASSYATVIATTLFKSSVIGITTGIMTLLILVFGEILPKSYASSHPKKFAIFSAVFLRIFQWIFTPLVVSFEWITNIIAGKQKELQVSEEEVRALAKVGMRQGAIEKNEGLMIERLFAFNDIRAEDIMTPRVQVQFMKDTFSIKQAASLIKDHLHTRFPVYSRTPDNVIGFVHSRDVLLAYHTDKEENSIKEILLNIVNVPRQMRIDDIMREFQKRQTHIAIVVDEYGGTEGIVTFEDVIEELVGEIADEHDINENLIQRIDKNTIVVAGDTIIRDINDFFHSEIRGNELDAIAERILDTLERLPKKNDKLTLGDTQCKILSIKKRRIDKVEIKKSV
ncbi:MAG: hemolysin [Candidatus Magasanikbacteria bacterium CG11_big_fil_rev_8_21_14_0_20_39_34]|uniref:Hemolysin n=1 Tax=Candidatus Magasanikbacteria bacterium CG11_big_fil_rev_8_21_14_0_20_39_34 TaxID=1974653 RepID=A0A2H0N8P6_9BACT|nr:MAG: hemolysin [Candidatus Magasanikbacteria bacterium CG11_big_fil_rev_8_21_14_0_20_39_34]